MATVVNVFNVVIAAGVVSVSTGSGIYNVDTEGLAPTDTISQITGAAHPHVYEFRVHTAGRYWTIEHNPVNGIRLANGLGFVTSHPDDFMILRASDKGSYVFEYARLPIFNT